jgi:hypothetical protein
LGCRLRGEKEVQLRARAKWSRRRTTQVIAYLGNSFFLTKRRAHRIGYFSFIPLAFLLRRWTPNYAQDGFLYDLSSLWK